MKKESYGVRLKSDRTNLLIFFFLFFCIIKGFLAVFVLSLWLTMAIVIFITHGRQEYCLTKHLIIIFNTGFCITLILAAVTPCARRPGNGIDRGRYGGRLLQVNVTYLLWAIIIQFDEKKDLQKRKLEKNKTHIYEKISKRIYPRISR